VKGMSSAASAILGHVRRWLALGAAAAFPRLRMSHV
jgi:hypothetical protein